MAIMLTLNGPLKVQPNSGDRFTEDEIRYHVGYNCMTLAKVSVPGAVFYYDAMWEIKRLSRNGYASITAKTEIHGGCLTMSTQEIPRGN